MHAAAEMWVSEGALLFTIFINDQKKRDEMRRKNLCMPPKYSSFKN